MMANIEFRLDIPATPLEGELDMDESMQRLLGPEFVSGVHAALRFSQQQVLPVYNAAGRNYYLPLPRKLGPYDALQVAGGGNFDLGITSTGDVQDSIVDPDAAPEDRVVVPPSEGGELFTSDTMFYEDGACVERTNRNPIGSYAERTATQKIENTQRAYGTLAAQGAGVITPKYVGKFAYEVADQYGDSQTAILLLVPSLGRRFDHKLLLPLNLLRDGQAPPAGEKFAQALDAYYKQTLLPELHSIGWGIEAIHAAGFTHHQLTPGNTDTLPGPENVHVPYITDWDTMRQPSEADIKRAQALDMAVAFQSASTIVKRLVRLEMIGQEAASELLMNTVLTMLAGYHDSRGTIEGKSANPVEVVDVAASNYGLEKILDVVEGWLA